jgi:hypothetical protein
MRRKIGTEEKNKKRITEKSGEIENDFHYIPRGSHRHQNQKSSKESSQQSSKEKSHGGKKGKNK